MRHSLEMVRVDAAPDETAVVYVEPFNVRPGEGDEAQTMGRRCLVAPVPSARLSAEPQPASAHRAR